MKFGLTDSDFKLFEELVIKPLKSHHFKVYVFGSRATSTNHPFSDIDILLEQDHHNKIKSSILSSIKEAIEESNFPIKVDFVLIDELAESYREQIMKQKIEI